VLGCFFFQAEDGIRDFHVTGVQTCALPILLLGVLVASEGKFNPELLPWLLMLNPTDIYRLLNIVAFGDSGQLSGVLSLGSDLPIGAGGLWLGLVLWCAIPLAGALLLFKNRRI